MQDDPRNKSFRTPAAMSGANDIERDREIVGEEIGRIGAVGGDAADLGRRRRIPHPAWLAPESHSTASDCRKIERRADRHGDDFAFFALEPPHDGGADHAGMAGDVDALATQLEKNWRAHTLVVI